MGSQKVHVLLRAREKTLPQATQMTCLRDQEVLAQARAGTRRQLPPFLATLARGSRGETHTRPRSQGHSTYFSHLFLSLFRSALLLVDGEKSLVMRAGTSRSLGVEVTGGLTAVMCCGCERECERASESRGWCSWLVELCFPESKMAKFFVGGFGAMIEV